MVYRYDRNKENHMSQSLRCAARCRLSRARIILLDQPVLVESSAMRDLGVFTTPIVPELGEEGMRKSPNSCRRRSQLDPRTPSSEMISSPPVATLRLEASPTLRGRGAKTIATNGCRMPLLNSLFSCPGWSSDVAGTG
jgi:hypothetical protein